MRLRETIAEYYQQYGQSWPAAGQVGAYRIEDVAQPGGFAHIRRDFYKIKLLRTAHGVLSYADRSVAVQAPALVLVNPLMPYSWQRTSGRETGYACLFTEEFITPQLRAVSVAASPLFRPGGTPVLFPDAATTQRLSGLFELVLAELESGYEHKYELLRNYLQIMLHEALKLAPAAAAPPAATSAVRLSALFLELLERQFPVASPQHPLGLKQAGEFARHLAVHPNHLNKALKAATGKTTTEHLAARLTEEARTLLRCCDWTLADISYCLGFEHPANFHSFFKRRTGQTPTQYRGLPGVLS